MNTASVLTSGESDWCRICREWSAAAVDRGSIVVRPRDTVSHRIKDWPSNQVSAIKSIILSEPSETWTGRRLSGPGSVEKGNSVKERVGAEQAIVQKMYSIQFQNRKDCIIKVRNGVGLQGNKALCSEGNSVLDLHETEVGYPTEPSNAGLLLQADLRDQFISVRLLN
ncbi:uncharacterized protein BJ212DRAFT_1300751 [Suillus subaureus]|uniref:Uncharacterized protein n=1 Tax=Suillus subaureus TaxID=48587 RepID=A0A9P7E7Q6_9AGAM|nr:uncharacterized protein BJ212DRAFT_1300751 [Suillus subaureus]KAG1813857.1 hypothetical protein BJ212DRAFT_1300751 [Suillus subaureus]